MGAVINFLKSRLHNMKIAKLDKAKCGAFAAKKTAVHDTFTAKKFGMFIHYNSATYQFCGYPQDDWCYGVTDNNDPRYKWFDPKDFNPTEIDFRQWARVAKSAGCAFAALTAKHHEGFALWPTKYSPHSVANSPYGKDVLTDYFRVFREEGVEPCLYFSMLDLNHNITQKGATPEQKEFVKHQLTELLTSYGDFSVLVIDGWNSGWGGPRWDTMPYEEINAHIKSLQPNILILNHSCENNFDHSDVVFFENAAGQRVPRWFKGPGAGGNKFTRNWFYKYRDDEGGLKSASWAVRKLKKMNRHNTVFLLNASPDINGRIIPEMERKFKEVGDIIR